ncbi:MAG: MarR family transcriptional regulator [Rhabdochlamydiaceae bacterium]|jgi:DNA-binding MarR family transcriptional regulator
MENLSSEEVNLLRHHARSVVRELGLLNDAYFEIGVTLAERHLLIELTFCSCPTMGEIAERLLLDKSTASRLISRAMRKGYIQCTTDQKDKRKKFIHLSELGRRLSKPLNQLPLIKLKRRCLLYQAQRLNGLVRGLLFTQRGSKALVYRIRI